MPDDQNVAAPGGDAPNDAPTEKPSIADLFAEARTEVEAADTAGDEVETVAEASEDAGDGEADDEGDGDGAESDDAETPEEPESEGEAEEGEGEGDGGDAERATLTQQLQETLESFADPDTLNAALERAGVDKLSELPVIKDLIGRIRQSTEDTTRAAIEKAQAEAAQIAAVTAEGSEAKKKLIAALNKASEDIANGEETIGIPQDEDVEKAFNEYANARVGEYHTRSWNVLNEQIYSLPEMGGPVPDGALPPPAMSEEQSNLLEAVKGAAPDIWLAAHLAVQRDIVWEWAHQDAAAQSQQNFENEKILLQKAHAKELEKLTKAHEKALEDARNEARATGMADAAEGRVPPKSPKGAKPSITAAKEDDDGIPAGASIGEIRRIVKAQQESGTTI